MSYIIHILTLFLITVVAIECGEYHVANGTKYFISYPKKLNWYQAQRYCTYYNMHLVSIHTIEESEEVMSVLKTFEMKNNISASNSIYFFTSGTDAGHNVNDFFWTTTGLPTIFKNWIYDQPDNSLGKFNTTDDCLLLNGDHRYRWYDSNCNHNYYFICQDKISLGIACRDCRISAFDSN